MMQPAGVHAQGLFDFGGEALSQYNRGKAEQDAGDLKEAVRWYKKAIATDDSYFTACYPAGPAGRGAIKLPPDLRGETCLFLDGLTCGPSCCDLPRRGPRLPLALPVR